MWELDHREGWAQKNWCFWSMVLEKTLQSPFGSKGIKAVNPKGNQQWIFIRRLILKLKLQYFGHLMRRTDSLEKTLMLEKIEGGRRRGRQRMRWHHRLEQSPGDSEGQGNPVCCSPWGCKELDITEWLNNNIKIKKQNKIISFLVYKDFSQISKKRWKF